MVEGNRQVVHVPWFSGICLEGEVVGQYVMDCGKDQEQQAITTLGTLELDELAPITILVGANNSGKSRLMRELFKSQTSAKFKATTKDCQDVKVELGVDIATWIQTITGKENAADQIPKNGWILRNETILRGHVQLLDNLISTGTRRGRQLRPNELCMLQDLKQKIRCCGIKEELAGLENVKRCYVPILRGMRPPLKPEIADLINMADNDWYRQRTIHDYFSASGDLQKRRGFGDQQIFTGLSLFNDLRERLLAKTQVKRDSVREYERFLSKNFFAGQDTTLIPVEEGKNDVVHIKIGNNQEYPIHDLGDGMQSLIICTYPIITETEQGSLFFLEEPDLCMHPSLQRTFLEVLKTYHRMKGHQFFLTTHSNHLLDLLEENELVSIFSFSQIESGSLPDSGQSTSNAAVNSTPSVPRFRIRASNLRDRQTLLELGVRPSATFLANATIWVEGISDCAYLRAYMEAFIQYLQTRGDEDCKSLAARLGQYKEDRHYAFVEYSGGNLTHFSFFSDASEKDQDQDQDQDQANADRATNVPSLCATAIVLADGDVKGKADRELFFAQQLNERFIVLPCKEIENMIPAALMKEQIERDHTRPNRGSLDRCKLERIDYNQYARSPKGIGTYLGGTIDIDKYQRTSGNCEASGTLSTYYKTRWRSEANGIPALIREALNDESTSAQLGERLESENMPAFSESSHNRQLPDYLTQDLLWLCTLLYAHIAACNHDALAKSKLQELQGVIQHSANGIQPSAGNADADESLSPSWPIQCAADRTCLLSSYLYSSGRPELSQPTATAAIAQPEAIPPT
ncbi:ATP-binding protein [Synechococcus sp. L2F]|uniref:AAA family ATPase n=1 Tax=Synechococcus sp. L2F TaxID=2823739 RepID=UPI0020CD49F9|nr:ATP-binding protein [Synechococcus sp. L2F]MCP9828042.1 ATP-binding protein [Synechococcus sp. L2F]